MAFPDSILQLGVRADQPAATDVAPGTLYSVTDESNIVEQSDGFVWVTYAGAGGGGGGAFGGLSAGTQSVSTGTVVFSNSNGITFGMSGSSQITASHNGLTSQSNQAASAANGSFAFQTLLFSDASGISFSTSAGSAVYAAHNGLTSQSNQAASAANGSFAFQTLSFSNLNGISFGTSAGSAITASHNALTSQSNQNVTAGNGGFAFQTLSFSNTHGFSFATSAGSAIVGSYTVPSVPVVSNAIQAVGSATGSGTNTSRFAADDHVHAGVFSVGVSTGGNTSGNTRVDVGRFVFQGGNNITLSQLTAANALNTIIVSGANVGGAQTGISGLIASDATYTSGSVYFSNQANVTIGSSVDGASQYVRLSVHAPQTGISGIGVSDTTYGSGTVIFSAQAGVTLGSSVDGASQYVRMSVAAGAPVAFSADASSTFQTLTLQDSNGISFSNNGGAVRLTHGLQFTSATSAITSNALNTSASRVMNVIAATNNTGGGAASLSSNVSFSAANGITFYTSAGNAVVASHNALTSQSNQNVTAANGGFAFQTLSFSNTHGFTFATSAGSAIVGSYTVPTVPAQLSVGVSTGGNTAGDTGVFTGRVVFVGSDNITLSGSSNAGSATLSIIGGAGGGGSTATMFAPDFSLSASAILHGNNSLVMRPLAMPDLQFDRILMPFYITNAVNSSGSHTLGLRVGIYTKNASTLSLVFSTSTSTAITHSGTQGSYSLYSGQRLISIPATTTLPANDYYIGVVSNTATAGANGSWSQMVAYGTVLFNAFLGPFGSSVADSMALLPGFGILTATTGAVPDSVAFSDLQATNQLAFRHWPIVGFLSGTV